MDGLCERRRPLTCILVRITCMPCFCVCVFISRTLVAQSSIVMSVCTVCLCPGGTVSACSCNVLLHAGCIANLIEHKYRRCTVCLANYSEAAFLASARHSLTTAPTLPRLLAYVTSAINAGKHEQALFMLGALPFDALQTSDKCQYLFEKARAQALQGMQTHAEQNFLHALTLLDRTPQPNPHHKAMILVGMSTALVHQKKLYMAAQYLCCAVQLTKVLRPSVVESIMRTIALYFKALGSKQRYVQALRTVHEIIQAVDRVHTHRCVAPRIK